MKRIFENKAELTTQQIVLLIVLIASFAVILFFLFRLNLGEETRKEICHNSVILKGKSILGGALDCKTNYVCISGGSDCKDIIPTETIKVSPDNKDEISKAIAEQMAECWWMFGEGKMDYVGFNVEGATIGKVNCALCSAVSFSGDLTNLKEIDKSSFGNFLKNTKQSGSQSYSYFLYGTNDLDKVNSLLSSVDLSQKYYVVTGIAQASVLTSVNNWFGSGIDLLNSFVPFIEFTKLDKSNNYGTFPVVVVNQEDLKKIGCDNFVTKA